MRENRPTENSKGIIKHELKEFFRGAHDRLKARARKENKQQEELARANIVYLNATLYILHIY